MLWRYAWCCLAPLALSVAASAEERPAALTVSRSDYAERLHGFWLGQSIANWTGLVTEMARVEPPFYTDEDWGQPADRAVWGHYPAHQGVIDFYLAREDQVWGADDDTDIEYLYLHLLGESPNLVLTPEQIRTGWLRHIHANEDAPLSPTSMRRENYLWVSNERAYYLMKDRGLLPPATGDPANNPDSEKIDSQLTTELFGLLAPTRPDVALRMARLPIRTTASGDAALIAEFYVAMHALAATIDPERPLGEELRRVAATARRRLPDGHYAALMYDFILAHYEANPDHEDWESTRDAVYERYQANENDGYRYRHPYDAGINFAASLVSLFYGDGDLKRTIQIAALAGWDSDNPAATWGGLLGFCVGKEGVERAFGRTGLPDAYWIHRTRRNFPDRTPNRPGEDTFGQMADRGVRIIDRVVTEQMAGRVDAGRDAWSIPPRDR